MMPATAIDLNADVGEGFGRWELGDDETLLGCLTSANVACGFHAGDPVIMHRVCDLAVAANVRIGAQVGYRDLSGFGRRAIAYERSHLADEILYQLGALDGFARSAGARVRYVKPHGALYNTVVTDAEQAGALIDAVKRYDATLPVLVLPGSVAATEAAAAGLTVVAEAFVDRAYTAAGTLVSRREAGAVIDDPALVVDRAIQLATTGTVTAIDGTAVAVTARSLCVHGDTPGATSLARAVRRGLEHAGVRLEAFT